jgi:hypothetical protein
MSRNMSECCSSRSVGFGYATVRGGGMCVAGGVGCCVGGSPMSAVGFVAVS